MPRAPGAHILRLAIALALIATPMGPHRYAAAASDRLPDLRMANLSEFRTEISGGERRLRFQTIMTNEGAGPLEVRGMRGALSEPHMRTQQAIYDTDGGVQRIWGADRYQTAAILSNFHHPSGAPLAYVATGQNFPDALGAGPPAAVRGAPTILVKVNEIPQYSGGELHRLNPTRIILLGGQSVINRPVEDALRGFVP